MSNYYLLLIIPLTIFLIGGMWADSSERKAWNGGVCSQTGDRWRCYDMDSQGGRMYKSGDYYCNISSSADKDHP